MWLCGLTGLALLLATSPASANGTLQYWATLPTVEDGAPRACLIGKQEDDRPDLGRYRLYALDPGAPVAAAENVPLYRGDDCTVFFDIEMSAAAVASLLSGQLHVQLDVCERGSTGCTVGDPAVPALDEPVDTVLDEVWALVDASLGDLQDQVDAISAFAPQCGPSRALTSFDIGALEHGCSEPLATEAALDQESADRAAGDAALQAQLTAHVAADLDLSPGNELNTSLSFAPGTAALQLTDAGGALTADLSALEESGEVTAVAAGLAAHVAVDQDVDPTNELQTWSTLPGIPAGLADGVDNDTTYDGTDFAVSGQACSGTDKVTGIDANGQVTCAPDDAGGGQLVRVDNFEVTGRLCTSVTCTRPAQTVTTGGRSCTSSYHCTSTDIWGNCNGGHYDYTCARTGYAAGESQSAPSGTNYQVCGPTSGAGADKFLTACLQGSWEVAQKRCATPSVTSSCSVPGGSCTTTCSAHGGLCWPAAACTVAGASASDSDCTAYATAVCADPVY
jgi:hypothetical protein